MFAASQPRPYLFGLLILQWVFCILWLLHNMHLESFGGNWQQFPITFPVIPLKENS